MEIDFDWYFENIQRILLRLKTLITGIEKVLEKHEHQYHTVDELDHGDVQFLQEGFPDHEFRLIDSHTLDIRQCLKHLVPTEPI